MSYELVCLIALRRHKNPLFAKFFLFGNISAARLATSAVAPPLSSPSTPPCSGSTLRLGLIRRKACFQIFTATAAVAVCALASVSVSGSGSSSPAAAATAAYFWPLHIFQLVFWNCLVGGWRGEAESAELRRLPSSGRFASILFFACSSVPVCGAPLILLGTFCSFMQKSHSLDDSTRLQPQSE